MTWRRLETPTARQKQANISSSAVFTRKFVRLFCDKPIEKVCSAKSVFAQRRRCHGVQRGYKARWSKHFRGEKTNLFYPEFVSFSASVFGNTEKKVKCTLSLSLVLLGALRLSSKRESSLRQHLILVREDCPCSGDFLPRHRVQLQGRPSAAAQRKQVRRQLGQTGLAVRDSPCRRPSPPCPRPRALPSPHLRPGIPVPRPVFPRHDDQFGSSLS